MKILKKGRYPKKDWEGLEITCPKCGTVFLVEAQDVFTWNCRNYYAYCPLAICNKQFRLATRKIPQYVRDRADVKSDSDGYK